MRLNDAVATAASVRCADLLAQTLSRHGITRVFGHPGGEVIEIMEALEDHGVTFVLTGHESAAAFMAAAAGRLTGTPGVCLGTLGPGACNLVLGVSAAYLDRDPLLAISARTSEARARLLEKQNLRLNEMFAPVTKASVALDGAGTAGQVSGALELASRPPRGPVFLSLPSDTAGAPEGRSIMARAETCRVAEQSDGLLPIRAALNRAERPIGVVGLALDPVSDRDAVRRFFRETGIPYCCTPQAKGVVDEAGDGYLGSVGAGAADQLIVEWLERSDCLLGIGFDPVESSYDWHIRVPLYSVADSSVGFRDFSATAECVGAVSPILDELRAGYTGAAAWEHDTADVRRRTVALLCPPATCGSEGLSPYHVVEDLRSLLPPETILAADVGAHKMLLTQAWYTPEPGRFLVSNGLSAMGYGVPTAITAALLQPHTPVVGIIGDGGFAMMVQELETARRLGVSPLFVVFCDRSLAIVKMGQAARGIRQIGVDFAPVDWAKVASGFGVRASSPDSFAGVREAVQQWLARRELTVLAVPVDARLYAGLSY
jgi:acetolactate synthase-1/2/3 large subunit